MVKLIVALQSLNKAQLADIINNCESIKVRKNQKKSDLINELEKALIDPLRLETEAHALDDKALALLKIFLDKKYRYNGMRQAEFAKFLILNRRMKNDFSECVNALREKGILFPQVVVKNVQKVVVPSEYLKFFESYFRRS